MERSARHKQMDQEHILEQVRPPFIDLATDEVTAHRIMRVNMRGHEKKLGFVMPTPKGAVERGQKDVHNMFNGLQGLCRKPVVMPLSMAFLVAMTSAACSTHLPIMTRPSSSMRTRWGYQTATLMK